MPARPLPDSVRVEILFYAPYYKHPTALAKGLDRPLTTLNSQIKRFGIENEVMQRIGTRLNEEPPLSADAVEQTVRRESTCTTEVLDAKGGRIRTVDQLLDEAGVDRDVWTIDKQIVNKYETPSKFGAQELFQVKAWLKRNEEASDILAFRDAAMAALQNFSPPSLQTYSMQAHEDLMQDICIPDLHLGKLAHAPETGADYDGAIAVKAFRYTLDDLLAHAQDMKVGRLCFAVGHDLLHVDGDDNSTTAGTLQDVDSRIHKSITRAVDLLLESVSKMLQIAPTDVIIVPGNHAASHEYMLGQVLRVFGMNQPRMTLHDSPAPRKYLEFGQNLLGFTHGHKVKPADLPLLMAVEAPQMWGRVTHRTWLTGHKHQRNERHYEAIHEFKGIEVKVSPSLTAPDAWHAEHGYIGNLRAAESHVYSKTEGEIARFRAVLPREIVEGR